MAILDEDSDKIAAVMAIEKAMAMAILMETTSVISDVGQRSLLERKIICS